MEPMLTLLKDCQAAITFQGKLLYNTAFTQMIAAAISYVRGRLPSGSRAAPGIRQILP